MITQSDLVELAGRGLRVLSSPLTEGIADGEDGDVRWHQVALEGEWEGHYQGPFKLDVRDFEQMVFHRRALGVDVVVDYEHNSLNPFAERAPAAGWIDQMDVRTTDQGLGPPHRVHPPPPTPQEGQPRAHRR
jgi:phage I-like protein